MKAHLESVRRASRVLREASSIQKNLFLRELASALRHGIKLILKANARDLAELSDDFSPAFRDRLTLTETRIRAMVESVNSVRALPDPVGEIVEKRTLRNGLKVRRERAPLGVLFLIFESRPNVAIEAFSLALKSGNAMILRGGKESRHTVSILFNFIESALVKAGLPRETLWGITDPDRARVLELLKQKGMIDVVVPRGGEGLIRFVEENTQIPIIKNDRGLCHVYVHEDADLDMAEAIVINAKTQRPGVCNSMETLLLHPKVARVLLLRLHPKMGIQWHLCPRSLKILNRLPGVKAARSGDWDTEYLDLEMNVRVVTGLDAALEHIEKHGSRHSEAIVTRSASVGKRFQSSVDAAAVYWNASTRFTDGFELGLGGELGISTQKLHVRGPVGLRELTSLRWILTGRGQIRR
jgi:glutamate-5-semialdehyde dehydrogenase